MGYVQESRAEAAVAALRAMSAADATVIRDGERRSIPAADIIPGDIIVIEEGDTIPADARLVESTGSPDCRSCVNGREPAGRQRHTGIADDVRWAIDTTWYSAERQRRTGTARGRDRRLACVQEMGRIAGLLKETQDDTTPLQRELDRTGKMLGIVRRGHRHRHDCDDHHR
jgi:Ca2+-transporting ATPase